MKTKYRFSIVLIIALLLLFPGNVLADEISSQFGGSTPLMVPAGHTVESVFALSTDAHIAGSVKDIVLVINGDVYLEPTAQTDLVIDLGGQVINPSNVIVKTGIVRLNFNTKFMNELFIGLAMILGLWFARLIISILGIVLLTGLGFLFRNRLKQGENLLTVSPLRLLSIGIAASLIILGLIITLSLTVIGIPFAILVLIIATGATLLGILPVLDYIGKDIFSAQLLEYPALSQWFIFALLLVSVLNLPLVGIIILLGIVFMGLGVATVTCWVYLKERSHRKQTRNKT
ncbi:hypothetical protein Desaci_3926 [Desulfosporosinus acidiphilus SJ4]|uniref:Uncharacterized protein n=1 Tax=Desulfosporosinus acidiphilus (strain DSM 22704 / JCM 16185 / SJ4) TaxID=646529 RepID=I4DAH7_DESAJ|nr:hypothetical protein [Desulfosporosinus acidiphilus]AFM42801.1 hypothetical protein Desaci_3926 [Desulfosporosinus acidiphilus SJ4]